MKLLYERGVRAIVFGAPALELTMARVSAAARRVRDNECRDTTHNTVLQKDEKNFDAVKLTPVMCKKI